MKVYTLELHNESTNLNFDDNSSKQIQTKKPHNSTFDTIYALERILEYENADSLLTDTDTMVQFPGSRNREIIYVEFLKTDPPRCIIEARIGEYSTKALIDTGVVLYIRKQTMRTRQHNILTCIYTVINILYEYTYTFFYHFKTKIDVRK